MSLFANNWTDRQRAWYRLGMTLVVMGIIGIILPLVGLKFRKFKDEQQIAGSIGLLLIGAGIDIAVLFSGGALSPSSLRAFFSSKMGRILAYSLGGVFFVVVLFCVGATIWGRRPVSTAPIQPHAPNLANVPRPIHLTLKNVKNLDLTGLKTRLTAFAQQPGAVVGLPPFVVADQVSTTILTSIDLDEFTRRVDFGKAEITNPSARTVTIVVDRSQFPERK